VAGLVIQATGRSEFENGLGSGNFMSGYLYLISVDPQMIYGISIHEFDFWLMYCSDPFYGQTSGPRAPKFSPADPKLEKNGMGVWVAFF
jgi:hypothetical protein